MPADPCLWLKLVHNHWIYDVTGNAASARGQID